MTEINRTLVCRVGVDLAKRVYQVHGVDGLEKVAVVRAMSPERFFEWCRSLQRGCVVAMESCSGAHHVSRRLALLGLDARILPACSLTPRWPGASSASPCMPAPTRGPRRRPSCWALAPSPRPQWWPRWMTSRSSNRPSSLVVGRAWHPAKTLRNARILWCVMTRGERFDPHHVPKRPAAPQVTKPGITSGTAPCAAPA